MRGFNSARLATLEKYLNSVIADESMAHDLRFKAAERLATTLDAEATREERFALAKERAAARRIEGQIRAAECQVRIREIRLQEQAAYVEPPDPPDTATSQLFDDLLKR